jgi:light-regulated signal transduction histidine kinase (bacteriophytochrome)
MASPIPSLHIVGAAGSPRTHAVLTANETLHPGASVRHSPDVAAASLAPVDSAEILVLLDATADHITAALAAVDPRGLPRWAVVPSSVDEAQSPEFACATWDVPMLMRSMRFAVATLALRRDNARLRGDLITIGRRLTHDLRTALNSINAANEVLAESAIPTHSIPELQRSIRDAVTEANSLIERVGVVFLASSRPFALVPVDMEEVVWNARQSLDQRVRSAGATIISCENWPVVSGVAALLETVWTNLLLNSLQHAGPAPRIEIGWNRMGTATRFWIRDSGPGVALARRSRLFHPLDRLNELNAPRGYGLSLVQRLIEVQSGTTGYVADPAPGGTFFFTLS